MSKLSNMLRMVLILNKRDNIKIKELSEILEVSERQIRRYREELEFSEIYIESSTGKYGGYSLQNKNDALSITSSITEEEEELINILSKQDYGDIRYLYDSFKYYFIGSNLSYLEEQKMDNIEFYCYMFVHQAKVKRKVIKIEYMYDLDKKLTVEKTIHPYITFRKYGQHYLFAYDEFNKKMIKVLLFKFKKWELTGDDFKVDQKLYDECVKNNNESVGVFMGDKEYWVRANSFGIEKDVLERVLECRVDIDFQTKTHTSFSFKTSSLAEAKRRVMLFGNKVVVWSPFELKDMIINEIDKMKKSYLKRSLVDEYESYKKQVSKHMKKYIRYNYGEVPYEHVMSKRIPISDTFLERNREHFIEYKDEIGELHSPRNFKSSQMMTIDYFLRYKKDNLSELQKSLKIDETFLSIQFEKIYDDYTHSDVTIELPNHSEILIECKYTENRFDYLKEYKEEHLNKFYGTSKIALNVKYQDINNLMNKEKITHEDFFKNYQLFRNVYNAFSNEKVGYVMVIIPKGNNLLDQQFNDFYHDLEYKFGFKYISRVKKIYWNELASLDKEFLGKYIYIKDNRVNLDMKSENSKIINDSNDFEQLIELSGTNQKNVMNIADNLVDIYNKYDILETSIRKFKEYDELITIRLYN